MLATLTTMLALPRWSRRENPPALFAICHPTGPQGSRLRGDDRTVCFGYSGSWQTHLTPAVAESKSKKIDQAHRSAFGTYLRRVLPGPCGFHKIATGCDYCLIISMLGWRVQRRQVAGKSPLGYCPKVPQCLPSVSTASQAYR